MVWGSESWDISCRPDEMGIIANGPLAGMPFDEAIAIDPSAFLGTRVCKKDVFPLLVKIITANDDLSIQVHPDDAYAAAHGLESGKSEMWYILEAEPGQSLIIGLTDDAAPEKLLSDPMSCLKRLPIKPGDMINIPPGTVHAITAGVKLAEIQQNSDVTFRLYDYGRAGLDGRPRELHLEHGIAVSDFGSYKHEAGAEAIVNSYFSVCKYKIDGEITESSDPGTFTVFTCVEGACTISSPDSFRGPGVPLSCERSVFIPAGLGVYTISGKAVLLKSRV